MKLEAEQKEVRDTIADLRDIQNNEPRRYRIIKEELREIATKFAEKSTKRQQAMAKLAADSQAGIASWCEEASAAATSKAF